MLPLLATESNFKFSHECLLTKATSMYNLFSSAQPDGTKQFGPHMKRHLHELTWEEVLIAE